MYKYVIIIRPWTRIWEVNARLSILKTTFSGSLRRSLQNLKLTLSVQNAHWVMGPSGLNPALILITYSLYMQDIKRVWLSGSPFRNAFLSYTDGKTATGTTLQYVRNSLIFNLAAGARSGAKKVVFVLTDGKSNRGIAPATPAGQLKSRGVTVFALGVTSNVRHSELLSIASSSSHVFHVDSYATLNKVIDKIEGGKCN